MASQLSYRIIALCCAIILVAASAGHAQSEHDMQKSRKPIYDEHADGTQQIDSALALARASHKRVLLKMGANWCGWCYLLHNLFIEDSTIASTLNDNYILVHIDIDGDHNKGVNERYGNPKRLGLPVLVVLDENGKQLTTQNTGDLEEGRRHSPAKVLAFLKKWMVADR